tara:strand:- start:254 stop:436 length:183 start_codon:yes stop_codon:yes gene_type:complete
MFLVVLAFPVLGTRVARGAIWVLAVAAGLAQLVGQRLLPGEALLAATAGLVLPTRLPAQL